MQTVSEAHKELYHYTTAAGLDGILRSQQLWATHVGYVNDAEEHVGFFLRRLPRLLETPAREAVSELRKTPSGRRAVENYPGGEEKFIADLQHDISDAARRVTLDMSEPYVTAFCSSNAHVTPTDGLLSQWRAYGPDGGYAVIFDSARLERMIEREAATFDYQFASFSDCDYDFPPGTGRPPHPERDDWERTIQAATKQLILRESRDAVAALHQPIAQLAARYKHHGFSEEHEVRIVAMPVSDALYKLSLELIAKGQKTPTEPRRPRKPIKFVERRGVLVPYIELLGEATTGMKLPISRILVGPHPDRQSRASSVRRLVKQYGLDIKVEVSETPYRGR